MIITEPGQTIIAPRIDCRHVWRGKKGDGKGPRGIQILADHTTIVNPRVENCANGITVDDKADGTPPVGVRVIADPMQPGYDDHGLFNNRYAMRVFDAQGIEIGGVNGGMLRMLNFDKAIEFSAARSSEVHHVLAIGTGPYGEAAMFGIKALPDFERDNSEGPPFRWSNNCWHHIYLEGISEEGLSYDSGGGDAGAASQDSDTVASVARQQASLTLFHDAWVGNSRYDGGGFYMMFASGRNAGEFARIVMHCGKQFKLEGVSPNWNWSNVSTGDKVSIGIVMDHNCINDNILVAKPKYPGRTGDRAPISFGGNQFYSSINNNILLGQPDSYFRPFFHMADEDGDGKANPQAITIRSISNHQSDGSVTGNPRFYASMNNCISGNTIENGDISAIWINFGNLDPVNSFDSKNYIDNNFFIRSGKVHMSFQIPCHNNKNSKPLD
jgi:hypothetical protein